MSVLQCAIPYQKGIALMHSFLVKLARPIFFLSVAMLVASCTSLQRQDNPSNQAIQKIQNVVVEISFKDNLGDESESERNL